MPEWYANLPPNEKRAEEIFTSELLAASRDIKCPGCRHEIVRSGGVVATCIEYPDCAEG